MKLTMINASLHNGGCGRLGHLEQMWPLCSAGRLTLLILKATLPHVAAAMQRTTRMTADITSRTTNRT